MDMPQRPPDGDRNRQPGIIVTTILVTVLANIIVGLRMITRKWIIKSIGWDDRTIIGALLGITIGTALVIAEVHYGFGKHKYYLSKHQFREFQKYSYGEWMQTFATLMVTKVSICLFLLRITISKAFIRPLWALITVLVLSNVVLTVLWIVQCRPLAEAWNTEIKGTCFSKGQLQRIIIAQAIISIASDFVLAAFPIFILRTVQISLRVKVGLCSLMGLGIITGTFCIVRTVLNYQNVNEDPTWISVENWYWRSWEVCIGIIAASIPTLRPLYKCLSTRIRSRKTGASSTTKIASFPSHSTKVSGPPPRAHHATTTTTATTEENFLPLQDFDALDIRKTTRIVVEREREGSKGSLGEDARGEVTGMEEARVRGVEDLV